MKNKPISLMSIMGGFTLVELMVAVALTGIGMVAIYKASSSQQKVSSAQSQVVVMQQDIRGAFEIMAKSIRLAGYDPGNTGFPPIANATPTLFAFRADLNQNGTIVNAATDPNEVLAYTLTPSGNLGVQAWAGGFQPVAENFEALNFVYLDLNGAPIAIASADDIGRIRSVQITAIVRTDKPDRDYTDTTPQYLNPQGNVLLNAAYLNQTIPQTSPPQTNRQYRRRMYTTTVYCRNLGL